MTRIVLKQSQISSTLNRKISGLQNLPQQGYDHFKSITPIKSGNARRRTRLQGSSIKANYPYATRLDTGWSRQAPKGMSDPTVEFMRKIVSKLMRSK